MLSFSSGELFAFSLPDYIIISLNASSHNLRTPVRIMVARKNVTQLCLTLYDPLDYSLLGSSVHRILQTRILEWIAIPFSREFSQPRDRTQVSPALQVNSLPTEPPGNYNTLSWSCSGNKLEHLYIHH